MTNTMNVIDTRYGTKEVILETTLSSFNISQAKRTSEGIHCTQWFTEEQFNKYFKFNE